MEKEITDEELPGAAMCSLSESITTEMFKEENVYQPEIMDESSNEVKSEDQRKRRSKKDFTLPEDKEQMMIQWLQEDANR